MDALITYDIAVSSRIDESKNSQVKDGMKEKGYHDHFTTTNKVTGVVTTYYLPNTTLWKKETTPDTALADLIEVAKLCKADVERAIATEFTGTWKAIPGKPYKK